VWKIRVFGASFPKESGTPPKSGNTPATTVLERADILLEATRLLARADLLRGDVELQILLPQHGCYRAATVIENFLTPH
jgi:hypothetical protein